MQKKLTRKLINMMQDSGIKLNHREKLALDMQTQNVYIMTMRYEWDERKRLANLKKHGLDFFDVYIVFGSSHVITPSLHESEERFLAIGTFEGRFVTVVYTMRAEAMRIISFRRARYEERDTYQKLFGSRA